MMWRLDNHWKAIRSEVPWVRHSPSDYVRQHVRLTTQPFEEPPDGATLGSIFELMDAGQLLMFSTDYPHHDADDPKWVMARIPKQYRERVLCDNALDFYNLPRVRQKEAHLKSPK
jgi:predicted TIM-barrel fold metal-dependent hydrolase